MALGEEINAFKSNENSRDGQEVKEKRKVRTLDEVSNMSTKQYLDEMVIPVLNKGLLAVNKEVRTYQSLFSIRYIVQKYHRKTKERQNNDIKNSEDGNSEDDNFENFLDS